MKKYINKFSIGIISFLIAGIIICVLSTGCSKESTSKENAESNPFRLAPYECNIIGEINVSKLSKLEVVKEQIEANKNTALVKELNNVGMGWNNINGLYFAISSPTKPADKTSPQNALVLLKTVKKIDIQKLIPIIEREANNKISSNKIGTQTVYLMSHDNNQQVFMCELTDNLIAIGSKNIIAKTIDLFNGKGKSVLDNVELMKLTGNAERDNMLWVGCNIDEKLLAAFGMNTPTIKVQAALIYADYSEDTLTVGGDIKCATKQDAQKILMPAQMLTAMFIANPNSGIKAEDISIVANSSELNIKISITKQILGKLAKEQMSNLPIATKQSKAPTSAELTPTTPVTAVPSIKDNNKTN